MAISHHVTYPGIKVQPYLYVNVKRHTWTVRAGQFTMTVHHDAKAVIPEAFRHPAPPAASRYTIT